MIELNGGRFAKSATLANVSTSKYVCGMCALGHATLASVQWEIQTECFYEITSFHAQYIYIYIYVYSLCALQDPYPGIYSTCCTNLSHFVSSCSPNNQVRLKVPETGHEVQGNHVRSSRFMFSDMKNDVKSLEKKKIKSDHLAGLSNS